MFEILRDDCSGLVGISKPRTECIMQTVFYQSVGKYLKSIWPVNYSNFMMFSILSNCIFKRLSMPSVGF